MISSPLRCATHYRTFTKNATMFNFTEPVHILGAGSIGLLWAASIRSVFPSYPVQLLLRNHHQDRLILSSDSSNRTNGKAAICLQSTQQGNNKRHAPRTVHVPAALIASTGAPFKNLLLTTKAFQARSAIEAIADRISPQTRIIILSNGALAIRESLVEFLQQRFAHEANSMAPKIHLAMTTHGAYRDDDAEDEMFHVVHAGYGKTSIEDYSELAQLFDLAGLNCESSSTLERDLWFKLAANCVINPLTALYKCANGEIRQSWDREESFDSNMTNILCEVSLVAQQVAPKDVSDYSVGSLKTYVESVMDATATNKSSMLQDVLAGRETEINNLNGFVVQQGHSIGIPCPFNQQLVQDVLALSSV